MRQQKLEDLLCVLQCPNCQQGELVIEPGKADWNIPRIELNPENLRCTSCQEVYPVSRERIPILWTPDIKGFLSGSHSEEALSANIDVYDEISDHYLMHVRKSGAASSRFMACIRSVEKDLGPGIHIDIGCGPGNVIRWSTDWAKTRGLRQVGLDVSIQNLRNLLATTNGYAVLSDAIKMPFRDGVAALVTEASVLHHIDDWRKTVAEASRIATEGQSAIIFDNEPTKKLLSWSKLARFVFESRFVVYKGLSYVSARHRQFRNMKLAKLNYYGAEVHNQPGRGFDPEDIRSAFLEHGRECVIYFRVGDELRTGSGRNKRRSNFLLLLSGANLKDPEYGVMTMIAT